MSKKLFGSVSVFSIAIILLSVNGVNAEEDELSSDTVITEDNVYEVLEYLNIDADSFNENDVIDDPVQDLTVGEFEEILQELENESTETYTGAEQSDITPEQNTQMLYHTVSGGSYDVDFTVAGGHDGTSWTSAGAANTTVSSPTPGQENEVDNQNLSTSVDGDLIRLEGSVTIGHYLGFEFGSVHMYDSEITTNVSWDTSYIP